MQEKLPWLNFLKIRASYGIVGNDRISGTCWRCWKMPSRMSLKKSITKLSLLLNNSPSIPTSILIINESAEKGWGYNEAGITENQMGADNLKWEKAKKIQYSVYRSRFRPNHNFSCCLHCQMAC